MDLLPVLSLHIFEEVVGRNKDLSDLNSLEPNTPAVAELLHLFSDLVTDLMTLAQDLVQRRVSNLIAHNRGGLLLKIVVRSPRVVRVEVCSKVAVCLERTIIVAFDTPDDHAFNIDTLHLACHLL